MNFVAKESGSPRLSMQCSPHYPDHADRPELWWGEVAHAMNRIHATLQDLFIAVRSKTISNALWRTEGAAESLVVRVFELRERILNLAQSLSSDRKLRGKLQRRDQRADAFRLAGTANSKMARLIIEVLVLIDDDADLRSMHTHESFCRLAWWNGERSFEIEELLEGIKKHGVNAKERVEFRRELRRFARGLVDKSTSIVTVAIKILRELDAGYTGSIRRSYLRARAWRGMRRGV